MKLVLAKRLECPPDGYRYTHAQDGHVSQSLDEDGWLYAIAKHCSDNAYPLVSRADAIDQLCHLLPPGWCKYENGDKPKVFVDARLRVRDVLRGTKAIGAFIVSGLPVVTQELASSRSATCARCYYNVNIAGCAPCSELVAVIADMGGAIKTTSDAMLKSCAVCKCATRAKTRLPVDLIAKVTTSDQMERFPEFCWVKNELLTFHGAQDK